MNNLPSDKLQSFADKIFSPSIQKKIDEQSISLGKVAGSELMENAGTKAFEILLEIYNALEVKNSKVAVLCGKGGNGGDGLVVARKLYQANIPVSVYVLAEKKDVKNDAKLMLEKFEELDLEISFVTPNEVVFQPESGIIVDAIFGTGFEGSVKEEFKALFSKINDLKNKKIVSLDCPSGVNSEDFVQSGFHLYSDMTISFGFKKPYHVCQEGVEVCGKVVTVDIGLPDEVVGSHNPEAIELLSTNVIDVSSRPKTGYKGTFGHTLIVGGSDGMYGAPILSACGALKSGSGLVSLILAGNPTNKLPSYPPEIMLHCVGKNDYFGKDDVEECLKIINEKSISSIVIGMGIGTRKDTADFVGQLINSTQIPVVLDADGLSCLGHLNKHRKCDLVLTPHPGEYVKYLSKSKLRSFDDLKNKSGFLNAHVIYKSIAPIISSPGKTPKVLVRPCSALAKAGSGDLLAGVIGGLLSQDHITLEQALEIGVRAHNESGHLSSIENGEYSSSASSLVEEISSAISKLIKDQQSN